MYEGLVLWKPINPALIIKREREQNQHGTLFVFIVQTIIINPYSQNLAVKRI